MSGIHPSTAAPAGAKAVAQAPDAFHHPLAILILQIILIITASRICAWLCKRIGQPAVMGEIIAGILLGPSLVGTLFPQFSAFVFPAASLGDLQMLSQIGLILFMFVIGIEIDISVFKKKAGSAMLISYFGMVVPFMLGIGLSLYLYRHYAPANIHFYAFSLFIGIAMSITAFPVLSRIIRERGITHTRLGSVAIAAAATDDLVAWCLLTFIVAIAKAGTGTSTLYTLAAVIIYIAIMLFLVRPVITRMMKQSLQDNTLKRSTLAIIFIILLVSAYCCEVIGIHALFGAFFTGAILPRDHNFRKTLIDKIEDVSMVLLLPIFFVFTGLKTQIGLLNDPSLWLSCAIIIFIAVAGKFGGSSIAARISGESVQDSLSIGALMNTRGLVELVVLNIGYDLGILSPQLFTMMVLMALITTLMTNPAINLINRYYERK